MDQGELSQASGLFENIFGKEVVLTIDRPT
jgi:hypothetical protein